MKARSFTSLFTVVALTKNETHFIIARVGYTFNVKGIADRGKRARLRVTLSCSHRPHRLIMRIKGSWLLCMELSTLDFEYHRSNDFKYGKSSSAHEIWCFDHDSPKISADGGYLIVVLCDSLLNWSFKTFADHIRRGAFHDASPH